MEEAGESSLPNLGPEGQPLAVKEWGGVKSFILLIMQQIFISGPL